MKKNIMTYILIFIVVAVWGIVFYRIFSPSGNNKADNIAVKAQPVKAETKRTKLLLNYRNPFQTHTAEVKAEKESKTPIMVPPPEFKYKGFIKGSKNKIIIVENNGASEVIKMRDSVLGYKIIGIDKDSLVVRKKGIRFCLIKN